MRQGSWAKLEGAVGRVFHIEETAFTKVLNLKREKVMFQELKVYINGYQNIGWINRVATHSNWGEWL